MTKLQRFIPQTPDPYLKQGDQLGSVKFGHINALVDALNATIFGDYLQLAGDGPMSTTLRALEDPDGNIANLYLATNKTAISGPLKIGNATANTGSAILQIDSTNQGVLFPRMTTIQRDAIVSPAVGLLVYNTTDLVLNGWNGIEWTEVGGGGGLALLDDALMTTALTAVVDKENTPSILRISTESVGIGTATATGLLNLYKAAAAVRLMINGDAGQNKLISFRTAGLQRFGLYVNNTAESGANVGSDFALRRYTDAGTLGGTPLFVKRSTGNVGINTITPAKVLDVNGDALVNGLTIGRGSGNIDDNSVLGKLALNANTTGSNNTAIGTQALLFNTFGTSNVAVGNSSLIAITEGVGNIGIGVNALNGSATGNYNTIVGTQSAIGIRAGSNNVVFGAFAIPTLNGSNNTILGYNTGQGITTGLNNTILGANVSGLSATLANNVIIADGSGNQRVVVDSNGNVGLNNGTSTTQATSVIRALGTNSGIALVPNGTGAITADIPDGTITGGNARGEYAVDLQMVRSDANNVALGRGAFVVGGNNRTNAQFAMAMGNTNTVLGQFGVAIGANNNITGGGSVAVAIGNGNTSSADGSVSIGRDNTVSSNFSTISGGQSNSALTGSHATVVGGQSNISSGQYSVSGGLNNTAGSSSSVAFGVGNIVAGSNGQQAALGVLNTVSGYRAVAFGQQNNVSSSNSTGIGLQNTVSNDRGVAIGSSNCVSVGRGATAIGSNNTITAIGFAFGQSNVTNADYGVSLGFEASSYLYGQTSFANGSFPSYRGFSQSSNLIARKLATLTTASTTILSLDGTGVTNLIIPAPNDRSWNVKVSTIAVVTAITGTATGVSVGDSFMQDDSILFKRKISVGSSLVGVNNTNIIADISMGAASMGYSAGASQELALTFTAPTFTGGGSVTCRVVSKVELVEVAY